MQIKFGWQWPNGSEGNFNKSPQFFSLFVNTLLYPIRKGHSISFKLTEIPLTQGFFMQCLVKMAEHEEF